MIRSCVISKVLGTNVKMDVGPCYLLRRIYLNFSFLSPLFERQGVIRGYDLQIFIIFKRFLILVVHVATVILHTSQEMLKAHTEYCIILERLFSIFLTCFIKTWITLVVCLLFFKHFLREVLLCLSRRVCTISRLPNIQLFELSRSQTIQLICYFGLMKTQISWIVCDRDNSNSWIFGNLEIV